MFMFSFFLLCRDSNHSERLNWGNPVYVICMKKKKKNIRDTKTRYEAHY